MKRSNLSQAGALAPHPPQRSRVIYGVAVLAVICLGLASRKYPFLLPSVLGKYPGDALWALMMYCAFGVLLPRASRGRLFMLALAVCFGVECFKFYQAPWIMAIRYSTLGHLVFGQVFSWQNLVAYTIGAATGVLLEWRGPLHAARTKKEAPQRLS